jgi:hypothetical protein
MKLMKLMKLMKHWITELAFRPDGAPMKAD